MKKKYTRVLIGIVAIFVIAGVWMGTAPQPMLLENDTAGFFELDGMAFFEDEAVPLAGLPEDLDGGEIPEDPEEPVEPNEGLNELQIEYVEEVLSLVNEEREKAGVPALELDTTLQQAAQIRAAECVGTFSHTRPDGTSYKTAIAEAGIETEYAGENVATGYASAEHVMQGWMSSSDHRANILNEKYTKIGIGLEENTGNAYRGYAWSQLFITQ